MVVVAPNEREVESAPTAVSHGAEAGVPTVLASGPALPAELATNTPASEAPRKATESGSMTVEVSEPTE
jgi:hypothetical protein